MSFIHMITLINEEDKTEQKDFWELWEVKVIHKII